MVENWNATVAAATAATSAKQQQQQLPAKKPFQAYAKESLEAALRDQDKKFSMLFASVTTASAASQRSVVALRSLILAHSSLRVCRDSPIFYRGFNREQTRHKLRAYFPLSLARVLVKAPIDAPWRTHISP